MDEPLSNLDAALRVAMRVLIKRLHQTMRTTFVYVTHDQAEAMTMADRIVVMRDGVIQHLGTPHDIYHQPSNLFVASFLGSPQINLVEGKLERAESGMAFVRGDFRTALDRPWLDGQNGRTVMLGLRPEDVRVGNGALDGVVELVSPLGSEQYANVRIAGLDLVVRIDKDMAIAPGDHLRLGVEPRRLHLFDQQTGHSLTASGGS